MASYNKVMLIGNLTRDPQLSYTPSQTAVVDFGLATNRKWTAQDGSQREDTCFVDCRSFGKQAETINKYLAKGRSVFVEGRLTFDSWNAQDGTKRSKHRITVENFQFLGGGGGQGGQAGGSYAGGQAQAQAGGYAGGAPAGGQAQAGGYAGGAPAGGQAPGGGAAPLAQENYAGPSVSDDDIPF
ncbi:MAG: single-stranded DNA-binding protein [Phycisphaeraceae bacterium]|nr:single-stranded DNA-binding protein [Phycisphaeraceae bacterium]